MDFKSALRAAIDASGLSMAQVAVIAGFHSDASLRKLLNGTSEPTMRTYRRLCAGLPGFEELMTRVPVELAP